MASPKPQTRQAAEKRNPLTFPPIAKRQWGPNPLKLAEELLESHQIPGGIVLDLGSGASITSALLARACGFIVYTTDLWSAPGENMRFFESLGLTNRNVIPLRIDASEGLPFAECFFDAVVSIDSYSYFGRNPKYLGEKLLPYVKPGGYLYLAIPGMHKDCHDDLPSELLTSWAPEQLDYMHDMALTGASQPCRCVWRPRWREPLATRRRHAGARPAAPVWGRPRPAPSRLGRPDAQRSRQTPAPPRTCRTTWYHESRLRRRWKAASASVRRQGVGGTPEAFRFHI